MVLDTSLLNTQNYKVRIKGKVELSLHLDVVAIDKGAFGSPSTLGHPRLRVTLDFGRQLFIYFLIYWQLKEYKDFRTQEGRVTLSYLCLSGLQYANPDLPLFSRRKDVNRVSSILSVL